MRVYPPLPDKEKEQLERDEQIRKDAFEDEFDDLSSVGTRRTMKSLRSEGRKSTRSMRSDRQSYGTSNISKLRSQQRMRKIRNVYEDLDYQIDCGWVEANLHHLSVDEMLKLFKKVPLRCEKMDALRLTCIPRDFDVPWDQVNTSAAKQPVYKYGKKGHRLMIREMADVLLGDLLRGALTNMFQVVMRPVHELLTLEIGVGLSDGALALLSECIGKSDSIQRLSFCGSCIGDPGLMMLRDGLMKNRTLRELDLTGCTLTDIGAQVVVSIMKSHTTRRNTCFWRDMLREYPNENEGKMKDRIFERTRSQVASKVAAEEGGLLLLELRDNKITDEGIALLYDAVMFDTRIMLLGLQKNKNAIHWQENFAHLLKDHPSLQQIDIRSNRSSNMGILRKRSESGDVMVHLSTKRKGVMPGGGGERWKGILIAPTCVPDNHVLSLEAALETPREDEADGLDTPTKMDSADLKELIGDVDDVGLELKEDSSKSLRKVEFGQDKELKEAPKVPRLNIVGGAAKSAIKSTSSNQVAHKVPSLPKVLPANDEIPAGTCVGRKKKSQLNGGGPKAKGSGRSLTVQKTGKGKRKLKRNTKTSDADNEVVEQMSGVLLQLHELVSDFEMAAEKDPHLIARLSAVNESAHRSASRLANPVLDQVVSQLKQYCHLDDSMHDDDR